MNERQHIALTEAQIIAAEKGEIQLEYRTGGAVMQCIYDRDFTHKTYPLISYDITGRGYAHFKNGKAVSEPKFDLFVSEQSIIEPLEQSPKPLYEVGEIIEQIESAPNGWIDVEFIHAKGDQIVVWYDGQYRTAHKNAFRKKQTEKIVTLEGKTMTVKEAFKYLTNL